MFIKCIRTKNAVPGKTRHPPGQKISLAYLFEHEYFAPFDNSTGVVCATMYMPIVQDLFLVQHAQQFGDRA